MNTMEGRGRNWGGGGGCHRLQPRTDVRSILSMGDPRTLSRGEVVGRQGAKGRGRGGGPRPGTGK